MMKKYLSIVYGVMMLLMLGACTNTKILEEFKSQKTSNKEGTYEEFFNQLAGVDGRVSYKIYLPPKSQNEHVRVIEVTIDKNDESLKYKQAMMRYKYNAESKVVKRTYIEINHEKQNFVTGAINLGAMMIESSLSK